MDLFLSYNSTDHSFVENIARRLRNAGLEPFLDRWHLAAGIRWRSKLEENLSSCKAIAIFVGPGEMGSWQQREVDVALDLQSRNANLPVIPVLLPGCEPPLGFLRQLTWVDLRTQTVDRGIAILAKAALGQAPGPELQEHFDSIRASISPYRGLLHFREEDASFFFGREAAIDRLANAVQRQPFVAVVGASGSGKSSVVRAGLVPRLRSDRRTAWETIILVPTDQPLTALARALVPLLEPMMSEVDRLVEAAKLTEHLRSGTISLYDIVERILEKQSGINRLLIVVDQFEELYTLTLDEEARRRFLDELLAASSRAVSKANVTLTLRGDFVGRALAYRPLSDRLQDAQINLGPMTREELGFAIRKPAGKIQLEFEPGLIRRILDAVGDEPGNLPLLEFVLKDLWDKRRGRFLLNESYDAIGGLQGAVATKADELFKGLSSAEQKILQRVFLRIVRPSESGLDTRRRAAFTELPPEGAELVVKLANERLLVTNQSASGQTVEVAHEALISNWGTLRAWVNEDREFLLWCARLDAWLQEWERAQESGEALLRGPLLMEAQKWFDQRSKDLSDQERKFISASREERERLAREEKERQEREIEATRRLAEEQKQRAELSEQREREQKEAARKLRRRALIAAGLGVTAVILGAIACAMMLRSESYRLLAEQRAQSAEQRAKSAEELARMAFLDNATKDHPWVNSLGMKFVLVADTQVLFSIWDTRVQDFETFVKNTDYDATKGMYSLDKDGWKQRGATWKKPGFSQGWNHPVVGVSWDDAKAFCEWLTKRERGLGALPYGMHYRLPTDEEWSMGLEGGNTPQEKDSVIKLYLWGAKWPPPPGAGNYAGEEERIGKEPEDWGVIEGYNDGYPRTSPVGSFAANKNGLYDMGGNVWQWCEDWYNSQNQYRVVRGGSWVDNLDFNLLSSARTYRREPYLRYDIVGFRCVVARESSR